MGGKSEAEIWPTLPCAEFLRLASIFSAASRPIICQSRILREDDLRSQGKVAAGGCRKSPVALSLLERETRVGTNPRDGESVEDTFVSTKGRRES